MSALPCVIDVEASGFGRGSYPIEVGVALPDGRAVCTLIRPPQGWTHWDGTAERLHGLTRELLLRHGRAPSDVAALLNAELAGRDVYTDNWAHDFSWLAQLFDRAGATPSFRLRHLRELLDEEQAAGWDVALASARSALRIDRHRASNDARVLQRALAQLHAAGPGGPP